jgi:hypothetical protein
MASKNAADYPYMYTVLFFDEANTTEAIGVIKEIIIVDIGNMMMCLMSHRLIFFSVRVSKLILTITQTDQE